MKVRVSAFEFEIDEVPAEEPLVVHIEIDKYGDVQVLGAMTAHPRNLADAMERRNERLQGRS